MQDLSGLCKGPLGGSSMSGANTVTSNAWGMSGPGSASEATSLEDLQPPVDVHPVDFPVSTIHPKGRPDATPWRDAHDINGHPGWGPASDEVSPGAAQPGRWAQS